jgi:hypothetical protein
MQNSATVPVYAIVGRFLWALVCDWQGALSTTGSVVLLALGLWLPDQRVPRWAIFSISLLCFLYAAGRTWAREHTGRLDAERKVDDGRPQFSLQPFADQIFAHISPDSGNYFSIRNCGARAARNVRFDPIKSRRDLTILIDGIASILPQELISVEFRAGDDGEYRGVPGHLISFFEGGTSASSQSHLVTIRFRDGSNDLTERHILRGGPLPTGGIWIEIEPEPTSAAGLTSQVSSC